MRRLMLVVLVLCSLEVAHAGPLFEAARNGDVEETRRLLAEDRDIDQRGRNMETPLHAAALNGHIDIARLLISEGADVMARNKGGLTPLHAAAYAGNANVAELLLDHGAVLEDRENFSGATPLMVAAEEDREAVLELLISRGADVEAVDRDGFSPLTSAWAKGRIGATRILKANGAVCQPVSVLGTPEYRRQCLDAGK